MNSIPQMQREPASAMTRFPDMIDPVVCQLRLESVPGSELVVIAPFSPFGKNPP